MPIYAFECLKCQHEFEVTLPLAEYDTPQECPQCQNETRRVLSPVNFVLKGDSWPGKALRVKGQMEAKNRRLDAKSKARTAGMTLAPNVEGERVDSWAEAKKLAASKGKDTTTYEPMVDRERG
jgi:putative FmdB family regulatory protein